jgi:rubrerythrin
MSEGSGYKQLKAQTSLKDILAVATEFERTARDFYADLAPKVSKRIRYLVEELAEEEQGHYDLFSQLQSNPDIDDLMQQVVETPASDGRFSDCIHLPELGAHPDDQAVLQYALGREHAAMEQYQSLADSTQPGPIHDLFRYLANEETKHKVELEKIYYEIVHSGGV